MANWCENDLSVEGPKEVIEEFLRFAAGESPFDFQRFIPYPEEFRRLDEIAKAWDRENVGRPNCERRPRPKDSFSSGGHEWCVANWGTKSPTPHVEVKGPVTGSDGKTVEVAFHFDTEWSPPTPVIKNAAERFPALRFELQYFECVCEFEGVFCCSGGKVEPDESDEYFGDRGG